MPHHSIASSKSVRAETLARHHRAIERVISTMHKEMDNALPLEVMAKIAAMSPFHFDRTFAQVTGISPCRFLAALRMESAKRLVLTTQLSVTELCFQSGYSSLGTFTTHFTKHVGVPPTRLRRMTAPARSNAEPPHATYALRESTQRSTSTVSGNVDGPADIGGLVFLGLFASAIPQGRPAACTLMAGSGEYLIADIPDGRYHLLAAAFPWSDDADSGLSETPSHVGCVAAPLTWSGPAARRNIDLTLRPVNLTDPPVLIALPYLLSQSQETARESS